jgi:hypothetical protein
VQVHRVAVTGNHSLGGRPRRCPPATALERATDPPVTRGRAELTRLIRGPDFRTLRMTIGRAIISARLRSMSREQAPSTNTARYTRAAPTTPIVGPEVRPVRLARKCR